MVLDGKQRIAFSQRKFSLLMIALVVTILIDISFVKIYDLIAKALVPIHIKLILFSVNTALCVLLGFIIVYYTRASFLSTHLRAQKFGTAYTIMLTSLCLLGILLGVLIFQQLYYRYYDITFNALIIGISYGTASSFILWLSLSFLSWFRSNRNLVVLLYFISMLIISFNLVITAVFSIAKISFLPSHNTYQQTGSANFVTERLRVLDNIFRISSVMSFIGVWVTSAILMNYYRKKVIHAVIYWVMMSIPLVYFLVTYFFSFIIGSLLAPYIQTDPITVSIIIGTFLSLSEPIGGLIFGLAFWRISKIMSYERTIKTLMIIAGWGVFLIFAANQALTQVLASYPPFGIATITVLGMAAYFMLLGIYSSSVLVSANADLRRFIHMHALESKLLNLIGQAEFEKEIVKTVEKITKDKDILQTSPESQFELDEQELRRYLDYVIREVKQKDKDKL